LNTLEQQLELEVSTQPRPSSPRFIETMQAYQRTAAMKAAIELDLFTAIGKTSGTVAEISQHIKASERGVRALCDFLVVMGFLSKYLDESEPRYSLTPDSATFLDKASPNYVGIATRFLGSPFLTDAFRDLAAIVRAGGPLTRERSLDHELPLWVDFAWGMAPIMYPVSEQAANLLRLGPEAKILDITASHGLFGIAVAKQNPTAYIVALDFPSVLAVAKENAERFGVSDRYSLLPGDALTIPFGNDFDAILVPNILHQWDRPTIETFLKKVHASLKPGGQVLIIEFAPNDDRVSPPMPASFVLNMLVNTTGGDAYPLSELMQMLRNGAFVAVESHSLLPSPQTAIVGIK
jgi:SAM-dependent methyltransferase